MDPKKVSEEIAKLAMPLLVERLGGTVEITEAEWQSFVERHGGTARNVGVQVEKTEHGFRLTVVQKDRPPLS